MKTYFSAAQIFDGWTLKEHMAVVVEQGKVLGLLPLEQLPADAPLHHFPNAILAPSLIDIQIYGGYGQMFSLDPTVESLKATYKYCLDGGASHFQATVATNSLEIMHRAIEAVKAYKAQNLPGLIGLHLEGPYLNSIKRGAHLTRFIHAPSVPEVEDLLKRADGVLTMMTLAPECCSDEVVRRLMDDGVVVSAGHSNATYEQAQQGFQLGIRACTHLYNAMSGLQHRSPGLVGAIFDSNACSSIVPDGIHVDDAALRIAKQIMGRRLFAITDAVTEYSSDSYTYLLDKDRYITSDGTLAGSCLTMLKAVQRCVRYAGIPLEEALRMGGTYQAELMGLSQQLGSLKPGTQADFILFDDHFQLQGTILRGQQVA